MTLKQRLEIRASEIRQRLNKLAGAAEPTTEQRAEMDLLTTEFGGVETRLRAAIISDEPATVPGGSGEGRERAKLAGRVELRAYLSAAAQGLDVAAGPERELRDELGLPAGGVPWAAIAPRAARVEERADAVTAGPADVGISQSEIIGRVFAGSATELLGVSMPMVPVGERLFPVVTAGASPAMVAVDIAKDAEAATIAPVSLAPTRLQARYLFRREDAARLAGIEEALRTDLSGALRETMDAQVLMGDGAAPNVGGFLAVAANGGLAAGVAPPGTVAVYADFASALAAGIDGRYATTEADVSIVMGPESYRIAASAFTASGDRSAAAYLRAQSAGIMASASMPDALAMIQDAILARQRGGMHAVAPVWEGVTLIRDEVTAAAKGQIAVTAVALWSFKILREAAFTRLRLRVAV